MAFLKPKFKFGASGGSSHAVRDEAEQPRNQELTRLYTSTRAGKHFQKDVVKGVEGFVSIGHKQCEIANRLAEDCKRYGSEGPSVEEKLSKATVQYGLAKHKMDKEQENLHRALSTLVAEPLKAMANGSPLKDARQLKQRYERLRQDADSQATEVSKRKKAKDAGGNPEQVAKLQAAEHKLHEITAAMDTMGRNALSALSLVESQQQNVSLQKILAMVEYERAYSQRVTSILDQLHHEIEAQVASNSVAIPPPNPPQPSPPLTTAARKPSAPQHKFTIAPVEDSEDSFEDNNNSFREKNKSFREKNNSFREKNNSFDNNSFGDNSNRFGENERFGVNKRFGEEKRFEENERFREKTSFDEKESAVAGNESFYATATHGFEGEDVGELTISVGDEVLVRQVTSSGWSEGLSNGRSGWFPSTYVKRQPVQKGGGARSGSSHGSR